MVTLHHEIKIIASVLLHENKSGGKKDNGSLLVIHCNAGANNVTITDEEGFVYCVKVVE